MAFDEVKNFAHVIVSTGYDADDTSIVLTTGHGAKLPTPTVGYSLIWWNYTDYKNPSDDPNVEIVRCTGLSTDTLTVTRGQESIAAATHNTGGKEYHMTLGITAKMITDIASARTIANAEITLAMMANLAQDKIIGRATASTGVPEAISCTAAGRAILDDAAASDQLTTLGALPLAGGTMSGDITLGENTAVALDPAGSADEKWSGITVSGTAGATLAVGDLCYLDVTAAEWLLTDADAAATSGPVVLGICILAAGNAEATKMLLMGTVRSAAFPASIALGAPVYISGTAGDITATQPTATDAVIRVVGWAVTAEPNTLYFCPSPDFITHT
jgi:hypothetical protein